MSTSGAAAIRTSSSRSAEPASRGSARRDADKDRALSILMRNAQDGDRIA